VTLDDVDDFEAIFDLTEEDDAVLKDCVANVRGELSSGDNHLKRQGSQVVALGADSEYVPARYAHTPTRFG
jgi:hypothetical protein